MGILNFAGTISESLAKPFISAWEFTLFYIIIPILIIILLIAFIYFQYKIIQLYIYLINNGIKGIKFIFTWWNNLNVAEKLLNKFFKTK